MDLPMQNLGKSVRETQLFPIRVIEEYLEDSVKQSL